MRQTPDSSGALMIIGGGEDRTDHKDILARFMALSGGPGRPLAVLTAASEIPGDVWDTYRDALGDLGARDVRHVPIGERADADDAAIADIVAGAGGIFMTGGDQKRLVAHVGGSAVERAMRDAYAGGACVAGTSAGASALCAHMLAEGKAELAPEKGAARLGAGLGFVRRVVVDQHFSQRHRFNRLLGVVAQRPALLGAGIDEDTALIVHGRAGIEVMGEGTVTVLDCRGAASNIADIAAGAVPTLLDVRLHLLPSGTAYTRRPGDSAPHALADFLDFLTSASGLMPPN